MIKKMMCMAVLVVMTAGISSHGFAADKKKNAAPEVAPMVQMMPPGGTDGMLPGMMPFQEGMQPPMMMDGDLSSMQAEIHQMHAKMDQMMIMMQKMSGMAPIPMPMPPMMEAPPAKK